MKKKYVIQNDEVLYDENIITQTDKSDINLLKKISSENLRKRVRLCVHSDITDKLHEMIIIHEKGVYVRPHKHPGKIESMHIIEGEVDVVIFNDEGAISNIIKMGNYTSGKTFHYRMALPVFHTLIIRSEVLVFHEITNGPFDRKQTEFATWSPNENELESINIYMTQLKMNIQLLQ